MKIGDLVIPKGCRSFLPKLNGLILKSETFAYNDLGPVLIHEILWCYVPPPAIGSNIQCWVLEENLEMLHENR